MYYDFRSKMLIQIKNLKLITGLLVLLFANIGCSRQSADLSSEIRTGSMVDDMLLVSKRTEIIEVEFATRISDITENTTSYVDENFHVSVHYRCNGNCDTNDTRLFQVILEKSERLSCEGMYFIGKLSLVSDGLSLWELYIGHNSNMIKYEDKCYLLEIGLEPGVYKNGLFLWNSNLPVNL